MGDSRFRSTRWARRIRATHDRPGVIPKRTTVAHRGMVMSWSARGSPSRGARARRPGTASPSRSVCTSMGRRRSTRRSLRRANAERHVDGPDPRAARRGPGAAVHLPKASLAEPPAAGGDLRSAFPDLRSCRPTVERRFRHLRPREGPVMRLVASFETTEGPDRAQFGLDQRHERDRLPPFGRAVHQEVDEMTLHRRRRSTEGHVQTSSGRFSVPSVRVSSSSCCRRRQAPPR